MGRLLIGSWHRKVVRTIHSHHHDEPRILNNALSRSLHYDTITINTLISLIITELDQVRVEIFV